MLRRPLATLARSAANTTGLSAVRTAVGLPSAGRRFLSQGRLPADRHVPAENLFASKIIAEVQDAKDFPKAVKEAEKRIKECQNPKDRKAAAQQLRAEIQGRHDQSWQGQVYAGSSPSLLTQELKRLAGVNKPESSTSVASIESAQSQKDREVQ